MVVEEGKKTIIAFDAHERKLLTVLAARSITIPELFDGHEYGVTSNEVKTFLKELREKL